MGPSQGYGASQTPYISGMESFEPDRAALCRDTIEVEDLDADGFEQRLGAADSLDPHAYGNGIGSYYLHPASYYGPPGYFAQNSYVYGGAQGEYAGRAPGYPPHVPEAVFFSSRKSQMHG